MNKNHENGLGTLPATAPLAVPFVPFQSANPAQYEPATALTHGTLFPGLDLPFMDYINDQNLPATPLVEMQTLSFMIQELSLYLDTHPDDTAALELYRAYQELYNTGKEKFEAVYGPLSHYSVSTGNYQWAKNPWPWDYEENEEG